MSIAYVAGASGTGGTALVISKPAGATAGKVCYMESLQDAGFGASLSGWTQIGSIISTPVNGFVTTLLRRVLDGSEGSSFTFAMSGGSISEGVIWMYDGVDLVTPEDATVTTATGTSSTITYPSIAVVTAGAWHLALCENFNALASQPTGYTRRTTGASWTTNSDKAVSGTVSGVTSTGGGEWVARSVLLRPAGGGGGVSLSGVSATGSPGSFGVRASASPALVGVAASGGVGSFSVQISASPNVSLTGVSASGGVGSFAPSVSSVLLGVAASGAVGSFASNVSATLSGVSATGSVGTFSESIGIPLPGVSATGSPGTFSVQAGGNANVNLIGVSATGAPGSFVPTISASASLSGVAGAGQVGSVSAQIFALPSGVVGTGQAGTLGIRTDAIKGINGVFAVGSVGTVVITGASFVAGNSEYYLIGARPTTFIAEARETYWTAKARPTYWIAGNR